MKDKIIAMLSKDVLAVVWIAFIASIIAMTLWFQSYIKDIIIISVLFLVFTLLEPYILHSDAHIVRMITGSKSAPRWKKFPLFFLAIVGLYFLYSFLQSVLAVALPTGGINLVFVAIWLILLFVIYNYRIISK